MNQQLPEEFIIQTDYFDLETNKESLAHYEEKCKELNVSLDYFIFEFLTKQLTLIHSNYNLFNDNNYITICHS